MSSTKTRSGVLARGTRPSSNLQARWLLLGRVLVLCLSLTARNGLRAQDHVTLAGPICERCTIELEHITSLSADGNLIPESRISVLPDGRYLAAPTGDPAAIAVFDPGGRFERTVGRRGSGPGEYREISAAVASPWGEVFVVDHGLSRITVLDSDLEYIRSNNVVGWPQGIVALTPDSQIVNIVGTEPIQLLVNGERVRSFGRSEPSDGFDQFRIIAVGRDRTTWAVRRDRYQVDGYAIDGRKTRTFVAESDWFVPAPEREEEGFAYPRDVFADESGRLWLLIKRMLPHWRPAKEGERVPEPSITDIQRDADFLVAIIDAQTGAWIASVGLPDVVAGGFLPGGLLYTFTEDDAGYITAQIWRARFLPEESPIEKLQ